jgi:hypothetical protein
LPLSHYTAARGLTSLDIAPLRERFGKQCHDGNDWCCNILTPLVVIGSNSVAVPDPTFFDIFVQQMLGPVPVFQV